MIELNNFYIGESVKFMKENIPHNFVDLIVTSPPYDSIRDYNGFILDLHSIGEQCFRVLKDSGILVMIIQDQTKDFGKSLTSFRTIVDWCDNIGFKLFECCIYERRATPGAWWKKRFSVDHEYIPIFIKGEKPKYFNKEHMMIDNPSFGITKKSTYRKTDGTTEGFVHTENKKMCPGTILHYKNSSRETPKAGEIGKIKLQHPATFPDKLAEDFIKCFRQGNEIVYDPMCGSGTTCAMAYKNNRRFLGTDISEEYINNIAIPRLNMFGWNKNNNNNVINI
jgi:site-specific DNA-methyltransferase (adenine-specific)